MKYGIGLFSRTSCRNKCVLCMHWTLRWRHNGPVSVSNHQPHGCLLNRLFRRRSKKTTKLRVAGLCVGNSPGTGEFPTQMASNAENVSIWWRHHEIRLLNDQVWWRPCIISVNGVSFHSFRPRHFYFLCLYTSLLHLYIYIVIIIIIIKYQLWNLALMICLYIYSFCDNSLNLYPFIRQLIN